MRKALKKEAVKKVELLDEEDQQFEMEAFDDLESLNDN